MYRIGSSWLKTKKPEKEVKPVDSLYLKLPLRQFKIEKNEVTGVHAETELFFNHEVCIAKSHFPC